MNTWLIQEPVRLLPGDPHDSWASCWTCFRADVLGERLAGDVHGADAPHPGGLGRGPQCVVSLGANLPARTCRSRSTPDHAGRRWPDHDESSLLSSRAMAAYQTDIRAAPHRPAWIGGHPNQIIRQRTSRITTRGSTNAGPGHAVLISVHPHSNPGRPGLFDMIHYL
jgi:hypothetical protein